MSDIGIKFVCVNLYGFIISKLGLIEWRVIFFLVLKIWF